VIVRSTTLCLPDAPSVSTAVSQRLRPATRRSPTAAVVADGLESLLMVWSRCYQSALSDAPRADLLGVNLRGAPPAVGMRLGG
jgi:hypothetical protein